MNPIYWEMSGPYSHPLNLNIDRVSEHIKLMNREFEDMRSVMRQLSSNQRRTWNFIREKCREANDVG